MIIKYIPEEGEGWCGKEVMQIRKNSKIIEEPVTKGDVGYLQETVSYRGLAAGYG